jgi:hypothetical protein
VVNHIEEIAKLLKDSNLNYILIRRDGNGIFRTSQGKDIPFYSSQQGVVFFRENQIKMIENRIAEKKEEMEELEKLLEQVNQGKNVFDHEK